ncbi:hypothetical protein, partial [Escherichia albertii]|uniref:hypothetical protein n=1 Tax=Escherichia albertii TaxID=208962 RepID=UPI001EDBBAE7
NDGHYFCGAGGNRPDGSDEALTIIVHSGPMNITVDYRRTNQKTDTGKNLKLWPFFVDYNSISANRYQNGKCS